MLFFPVFDGTTWQGSNSGQEKISMALRPSLMEGSGPSTWSQSFPLTLFPRGNQLVQVCLLINWKIMCGYLVPIFTHLIFSGNYPGNHGIIANVFYERQLKRQNRQRVFFNYNDSRLTRNAKWWNKKEPLWATATMQGLKFANFLFSR